MTKVASLITPALIPPCPWALNDIANHPAWKPLNDATGTVPMKMLDSLNGLLSVLVVFDANPEKYSHGVPAMQVLENAQVKYIHADFIYEHLALMKLMQVKAVGNEYHLVPYTDEQDKPKKNGSKKRTMSFRIHELLVEAILKEADSKRKTYSDVVQDCLAKHFKISLA